MTSIVTTGASLPEIATLHQLYAEIQRAETPEDAATVATRAHAIHAVLKAANYGLEIQNEAAAVRLTAERKLGSFLTAADLKPGRGGEQLPEGVSRDRSSRAQKLALIPDGEFATYISNTRATGKELTFTAALKLAPTMQRPERKSIADTYTAPPIDVQIAREMGLDVSDELAEIIVTAISDALATMDNPRHAFIWAKYHGIQDDGTIGDTWHFPGIAAELGTSREYVEGLYYRASHHVRGAIAVSALTELQTRMIAA